MPYRDLPNTDLSRLQALDGAAAKAAVVDPASLAFSAATKTQLDTLRPQFQTEVGERGQALAAQSAASQAVREQAAKLRMYVSQFFQILNFGIDRGVFAASNRAYYQLDISQTTLPDMGREADLLTWAGRVVSGEALRTDAGGAAIPFPTAAEVQTELTQYIALAGDQSAKKDTYDSEQEDVDALRDDVDSLIRDIWDEVEFSFRHESPSSLRRKAREYGVVYVSRPGEAPDDDDGNGGGATFPFDSIVTPEGNLVLWFQMPEDVPGVTNILVREGTEQYSTNVLLNPGQSQQLTWEGAPTITGEIDEVALRDAENNVLATGVREPELPDPGV